MFADLDKRGLMTISDITPEEARTLMKALKDAIRNVEAEVLEEDRELAMRSVYTEELTRLRRLADYIGFYTPTPEGKRAKTVGEVKFG